MALTEEQRQRMEQNRLAALRKREELARQRAQSNGQPLNQPNRTTTAINPNAGNPTASNQNKTTSNPNTTANNPNRPAVTNQTNSSTISNGICPPQKSNPTVSNGVPRPTPQPNPTNSNGIRAQPQLSSTTSTTQPKYSFNRINANAVQNRPNPPYRQPPNNPTASYGNNTASSFAIPPANRPANQIRSNPPNNPPNASLNSSSYITPAKRPAGPNDHQADKRLKTGVQAKSPYEQIMTKAQTVKIEFSLLNNREFCADFKYHVKLVEEVRKLKGARFDGTQKKWAFKLEDYEEITKALGAIRLDRLTIQLGEGIPKNVRDILADSLKYNQVKVDLGVNKYLPRVLERLFPYQKEGVMFGVRREGRCLIADDMGLGKTMQAIGLALYYFDDWPLLIVCPASVKFQWVNAMLDWVPNLTRSDILEIDSSKKKDSANRSHLVVITSYNSIHKADPHFPKGANCVILDECHMIKESKTQRFQNVTKLAGKAKRLILVSGTPAMSKPIELFTQLKLLMPKVFSNKSKYAERYCDPKDTAWGVRDLSGCTRPDELKVILESTVMIRRMKADILNELPPKRRVKINLDGHILGAGHSEIERFAARFKGPQLKPTDEGPDASPDEDPAFLNEYAKTAEIKLQPVLNYLETVLEEDVKFIVFAHHRTMIDGLCEFLSKKKKTFIKIDGSTSPRDRQEGCELFQSDARCRAAVLSITAAGVGLTLTAAQRVIFAELYFNPGSLIQAEDRAHRIGQKEIVHIEYLMCPGTADDRIWSMVHQKIETLSSLGIENDGFNCKSQDAPGVRPATSAPVATPAGN